MAGNCQSIGLSSPVLGRIFRPCKIAESSPGRSPRKVTGKLPASCRKPRQDSIDTTGHPWIETAPPIEKEKHMTKDQIEILKQPPPRPGCPPQIAPKDRRLMTISQAAGEFGITRKSIYDWIKGEFIRDYATQPRKSLVDASEIEYLLKYAQAIDAQSKEARRGPGQGSGE